MVYLVTITCERSTCFEGFSVVAYSPCVFTLQVSEFDL